MAFATWPVGLRFPAACPLWPLLRAGRWETGPPTPFTTALTGSTTTKPS